MKNKWIQIAGVIILIGISYWLGTLRSTPAAPLEESSIPPTCIPTSAPEPTASLQPTEIPTATISVPTAEPTRATSLLSEKDQMELVLIPAGEFSMGSADIDAVVNMESGVAIPEIPLHILYLDDYWIDKYEVTNAQYALCVTNGGCEPPKLNTNYSGHEYYPDLLYANYPVIYVNWFMAQEYCEWAGRRLPTEAEWEKAARGTDSRRYPWGNDPLSSEHANFCNGDCPKDHSNPDYDDGFPETAPVGSFPAGASPYGVMDMSGNVWEWTSTIPMDYPYDATDGREAEDGFQRIWRGGPWSNGTWWMRSSIRYRSVPHYWYNNLGFRCAVTDPIQ